MNFYNKKTVDKDELNAFIRYIVVHSGGASNEALVEVCTSSIMYRFRLNREDEVKNIYGKNGIIDPVKYRIDNPPLMNGLERLTPKAFDSAVKRNYNSFLDRVKDCLEDNLDGYIKDHFTSLFGLSISEGQQEYFDEDVHVALRDRTKEYVKQLLERLRK